MELDLDLDLDKVGYKEWDGGWNFVGNRGSGFELWVLFGWGLGDIGERKEIEILVEMEIGFEMEI